MLDIFESQIQESHVLLIQFATINITILLCFLILHLKEVIGRRFVRDYGDALWLQGPITPTKQEVAFIYFANE